MNMMIAPNNLALAKDIPAASDIGCDSLRATRSTHNDTTDNQEELTDRSLAKGNRHRLRRSGRSLGGPRRTKPESTNCNTEFPRPAPHRMSTMDAKLSEPAHYSLFPRRSSLSSQNDSTTSKGMPQKRVSFTKADFNQVPMLNLSEAEKNEIWYNDKELSKLRRKVAKQVRKGEEKLDETQDCWRGLESYVKQFAAFDDCENETEECNKIILQLQKELSVAETSAAAGHSINDLQGKAQDFLRKAMTEGAQQAAQDAAEAHAIYMETMDSKQVQACFPGSEVARVA